MQMCFRKVSRKGIQMEEKYTWIVAIDNSEDDMTAEFFKIEATKSELKHMFMDLQEEAIADDKENFRYGTGSEMEIFEEVDPITGSVSKFMVQAVLENYTISWNACREDCMPTRQP